MQSISPFDISIICSDLSSRISLAKILAREIAFNVPPVREDKDPSKPWTIAIRNVLRKLKPIEWIMFPPEDHTCAGEFMVDTCWWVEKAGAALVAEFEWLSDWQSILKDFDKIAVMKSPLKLMIYHCAKGDFSSKEIRRELKAYLAACEHHIKGETYLFIEYLPSDRVSSFLWQANSSGSNSDIEFSDIFVGEKFQRSWRMPEEILLSQRRRLF